MTLLAALARVEDAKKKIHSAKSEKERERAIAELSSAISATEKYKKKTTTVEEVEDDGEESEEESEEEESEEEAGDDEDDDDKSKSTGSTEDSTKAEEEGKKMLGASTGLYTYSRLFRHARQMAIAMTGNKNPTVPEVFDAISNAHVTAKQLAKLSSKVEKMDAERRAEKAEALISRATRDGVLTPAEAKALAGRDLGEVKGYLAIAEKRPRLASLEDAPALGSDEITYANAVRGNGSPKSPDALANGHGAKKPVQLADFNRMNGKG